MHLVLSTPATPVARRTRRCRPAPGAYDPLLVIFGRTAEHTLRQVDPAVRLAQAANLCESLAKSEPEQFDRLSADALRWPTRFMLCVLADLSASLRASDPDVDASQALARSVHFVQLWIAAVRSAYTDPAALPQDRVRARAAMRVLRARALAGAIVAEAA